MFTKYSSNKLVTNSVKKLHSWDKKVRKQANNSTFAKTEKISKNAKIFKKQKANFQASDGFQHTTTPKRPMFRKDMIKVSITNSSKPPSAKKYENIHLISKWHNFRSNKRKASYQKFMSSRKASNRYYSTLRKKIYKNILTQKNSRESSSENLVVPSTQPCESKEDDPELNSAVDSKSKFTKYLIRVFGNNFQSPKRQKFKKIPSPEVVK